MNEYDRLKAQKDAILAKESVTYGDLVRSHPSIAETIEPHVWDNKSTKEQLDWALAELQSLRLQLQEAIRLVDFYRKTHGCEDADICTGCSAATQFLAARATDTTGEAE